MCLGSARFVSTQAIFISRQVPLQAAFVKMQTRELCLKKILPRQKLPSHYRPQMYVCQEELTLPFLVSNKLSRNWTTGSTSPSCTPWQLWLRPVFKKNTEFWEESDTVSPVLCKPGLSDPSRGLARTSLGPSWAWGRCWHPADSLGLWASPAALWDIFPWSHSWSFSFWRLHSWNTELCQRLQIRLLQTQLLLWTARTVFPPPATSFWPCLARYQRKSFSHQNPQSFASPGAFSPNLHTSTLWLPLRKLHLFKPLSLC